MTPLGHSADIFIHGGFEMVSRTATYALHVLGALAGRPAERLRGEELARETGIPRNYLSKVLNQLRKQGLVDAEKGWGGGFRLAPGALARPIRDVVAVIDGPTGAAPHGCLFGLPRCDAADPCPLHDRWERIREGFDRMLGEVTVADLARDPGSGLPPTTGGGRPAKKART
jgi:Rrf2 family protein